MTGFAELALTSGERPATSVEITSRAGPRSEFHLENMKSTTIGLADLKLRPDGAGGFALDTHRGPQNLATSNAGAATPPVPSLPQPDADTVVPASVVKALQTVPLKTLDA